MAYEISPQEGVPAAVERVMLEQIGRIEAHLRGKAKAEKRVHDARKRMKEIRAVLRMVRPALGAQFAIENTWYRDAARDLASARDAAAMLEALDKLRNETDDRHLRRELARAKRTLRGGANVPDLPARIDNLLAQLADARERLARWPRLDDRFATIGDGIERTHRDGRRALAAARRDPSPDRLHALRKRVKDHWYHTQLLRPVWPAMMKSSAKLLEELSGLLGDHHDLAVVRESLGEFPGVLQAIDAKASRLETAALELAAFVFAEKPRAWRDRVRAWWRQSVLIE